MEFEAWLCAIRHQSDRYVYIGLILLFLIFIICSDKASVPVPLGYYDNKLQLLADISNNEQLGGTPIILRGLHAAREQFKRHGRDGVSKILLLVTSGVSRFVP